MKLETLKDKIRSAEISRDPHYAVQALEDYFRENNLDIDLWWLSIHVGRLCDNMEAVDQLAMLHGLAETSSIDELEQVVVKGLDSDEKHEERLEELVRIKQELRKAYTKLVASLT